MHTRLVFAVVAIIVATLFVPVDATVARAAAATGTIRWSPCPGQAGAECAAVAVPADYRTPGRGQFALALARHAAVDRAHRIGVLLFNPGGPGESGVQLLGLVMALLPPAVASRFDVIAFDERGTGASNRVDCGTSPAAAASVLPVPARQDRPLPGTRVFDGMADRCQRLYGTRLGDFNTTYAAHDLDVIRAALGESRINYLGLSYGTLLGATYAQLFPHRVRTMVLDGAIDPAASLEEEARQEAPAIEASLAHFFDTCSRDPKCALYPDPAKTYQAVKASLEEHPLPAPGNGDDNPVTVGDLDAAALLYLSVPNLIGAFPAAVQSAAHGDGTPLRQTSLTFFTDLDGSSLVDPLWTITCEDQRVHPDAARAGRLAWDLNRRYPLIGAYAATYDLGGCVSWPRSRVPVPHIRASGAPPIVVIGNTGDPNTPHLWAQRLAHTLASGVLLTWQGWGHTWLLNGSTDACMTRLLSAYVLERSAPSNGRTCT